MRLAQHEEDLQIKRVREIQRNPRHSALNRPIQANMDKLHSLMNSCLSSPRRALYPSLEDNLKKAASYIEICEQGGDNAEQMYRRAYSILREYQSSSIKVLTSASSNVIHSRKVIVVKNRSGEIET